MKSRPFVILGCALVVAATIWFSLSSKPTLDHPPAPAAPGSATSASANTDSTPPPVDPALPQPSPPPPPSEPAATIPPPPPPPPPAASIPPAGPTDHSAAATDLDKVNLMFRDYRTLMGENPVGTNAEIMKAIMGGNPKKAVLGPPEGLSLNGRGELLDQWGTPFFFHQMSKTHMEIWSAGPDKIMGTSDDIILK